MALKARKLTKSGKKPSDRKKRNPRKTLLCDSCNRVSSPKLESDVVKWTCSYCVSEMAPWERKEPKEKRPRGWHRKKLYISPSNIAYSYGKEISDDEKQKLSKEVQ